MLFDSSPLGGCSCHRLARNNDFFAPNSTVYVLCDSLPDFVQRNGGCLYFSSSNAFYPLTCWLELRAIEHAMRRNSAGATRVSAFVVSLFGQFETRLILEHKLFNTFWLIGFFVWFAAGPGGFREGRGSARNLDVWPWEASRGPRRPRGPGQQI